MRVEGTLMGETKWMEDPGGEVSISQGWERKAVQAVFLEEVMAELSPEG